MCGFGGICWCDSADHGAGNNWRLMLVGESLCDMTIRSDGHLFLVPELMMGSCSRRAKTADREDAHIKNSFITRAILGYRGMDGM